jgi:hypothetical protein
MKRIADFVDRYRWGILLLGLLITLYFAYQLRYFKVGTNFEDLLPQKHPYIKVHNQIRNQFGGANQVLLMLQVRKGDIFNQKTLKKVQEITEKARAIHGVNPDKIQSIATRRAKHAEITSGVISFDYLMFPDVPQTQEKMDLLRHRIYSNPRYYGPYVSLDSKKILITVDFYEEAVDFQKIFADLSALRREIEDENHILNIAGEPMLLGYIHYHNRDIFFILAATVLVILVFLYFYFKRSIKFLGVTLITSIVSGIWGLGFMAAVGFNLDPLVLVLPFLLCLMTGRHAMQLVFRYIEEVQKHHDKRIAAKTIIETMLAPGLAGVITDAFGIALVGIAAIPVLQKISITCAFWSISTVMFALIFTPILLAVLPGSRRIKIIIEQNRLAKREQPLEKILGKMGEWMARKGKWVVVCATVVITMVSFYYAQQIEVGDFIPGSPILWQDHRYNQDALRITYSMPLLNPIYVIMKAGEGQWSMESPEVIKEIDRFQRHLARHPRVAFTQSIINQLPSFMSGMRDGDPNYYFIPQEPNLISYGLKGLLYRSRPGDWREFINDNASAANIMIFCRDKMPETLRGIMEHINKFVSGVKLQQGEFLLAGGALGVQAAVRDVIARAQIWNLTFALLMVLFFSTITFRSIVAGLILTIPLAISNLIAFAMMGAYQIGLTVNTYPVSSVGIGLGVDYGLYFIGRLLEEKKQVPELERAVINTIRSNGKSIFVIATTLCLGLLVWLLSNLKFQAEMGALLAMLLFLNMLGALFLVPSFILIIKPRFVQNVPLRPDIASEDQK